MQREGHDKGKIDMPDLTPISAVFAHLSEEGAGEIVGMLTYAAVC